ncbi:predicted protein [Postia placenta Mad-698-R]|nr:predicted protein [Postia placenta Mad-698-R]
MIISNAVWRAVDLDADPVFRDLARFSSITVLSLRDVGFPTILTLGRIHSATFRCFHHLPIPSFAMQAARDAVPEHVVQRHRADSSYVERPGCVATCRCLHLDKSDVGFEGRADELRACLPKLDERGILRLQLNDTRVGVHWDNKTGSWKHYGVGRRAAQGTVMTEEVSMADGGTCVSPCDDSEAGHLSISSRYGGCFGNMLRDPAADELADPYFSVCYLRASCPYEPSMPIGFTFIISRTSNSRSDMPIPNEICSAVLPSARKTDTNWEKARIATPFRDFARLMRTSLAVGRHAKRDSQRTTSHSKLVFWLFTRCRQKDNV